jgi:hypothetical protein
VTDTGGKTNPEGKSINSHQDGKEDQLFCENFHGN